jgi:hypothetical protein
MPPSTQRAAVGPEPKFSLDVRTWLEQVDLGIDCPMSLDEAHQLRTIAEERTGDVASVMGRVACMCDVTARYQQLDFDAACRFAPEEFHYFARSRDEARVLAWHNALVAKIRSGATPETLARPAPVAKELKQLKQAKKKSHG